MAIFGQLNHFNGDPSLKVSCEKEENWEVKELQSDWVDLQSMEILTPSPTQNPASFVCTSLSPFLPLFSNSTAAALVPALFSLSWTRAPLTLISLAFESTSTQPSEWYFYHKGPLGSFSSSEFSRGSYLLPEGIETPYMAYRTLSDLAHDHLPSIITAVLPKQYRTTWNPLPLSLCMHSFSSLFWFALSTLLLMVSICLFFKHFFFLKC